mmetsp:Transcript_23112/g.47061  ORF Transcript_23112/g.47061 Transcript_23112/m.47061 type:complete len:859 (-) Transcript_23112:40-2616(-)
MADLVGRTINASGPNATPNPPNNGNNRNNPRGSGPRQVPPTNSDSRLYSFVETALMNVPVPEPGKELRPSELVKTKEMMAQTWDAIRAWLAANPNQADRQSAAMHQGRFMTTALHMVCKLMNPPVDIIEALIECAPDTVTWADSNGWLPLHHACANGASGKVLAVLVEAYPEGKVKQDKRFRTPLHFAFFRKDIHDDGIARLEGAERDDDDVGNSIQEIVELLSDSGACELKDEGGMLPMHYASVYGTTTDVLEILYEAYPGGVAEKENKGRNALHLAMVNAHRSTSATVTEFLLENNASEIINEYDDDRHLPIHLLAMASKFPPERVTERQNASACLEAYLDARPKASADFLTAIQKLPTWLRDEAVISDHIQDILNHKIVMRFPTMILLLDFFFLVLSIVFFEITTLVSIDHFFTVDTDEPLPPTNTGYIFMTLICAGYFLLREIVQMISLLALGNISSMFSDPSNWLDFTRIFFLVYFGGVMLTRNPMDPEMFRSGTAIAKGVLWASVISFLKSTQVEVSVFVSGVVYVVQRLAAFMMAMAVILLMFAQMFYTVYAETELCDCNVKNPDANPFPYCTFQDSLLNVYLMMTGTINNEMRYITYPVTQLFYIAFTFFVVILLSNVLIAIVTDSYGVIKNERAAMVFWSNRLDFVAEIDAMKNVSRRIKACFVKRGDQGGTVTVKETPDGEPLLIAEDELKKDRDIGYRTAWQNIMNLFNPDLYKTYNVKSLSFEFWCYMLVRIGVILFVIPLWLTVGLCTAGWFWPPQVREYLFQQKKAATSRADMAEEVTEKISELKNEIKQHELLMLGEMKNDRKELALMKSEVELVQAEIMADLLQVKEILVTLLDMSRANTRA